MVSPRCAPPGRRVPEGGFTLMEVMIAIAIVGILTAIAMPQYNEYVRRSRIVEATNGINDFRTRMEQYFQDNRSYANGGACGVANPPGDAFTFACSGASATGYQMDATGSASKGMSSFAYRLLINAGVVTRSTQGLPAGWTSSGSCWVVRKDGSCS